MAAFAAAAGSVGSRTLEVPSIVPVKDGYVGITMVTGQQWLDFCAMVECPELEDIPQLRFQIGRWEYRDLIRESIGPWMAERTVEEIVELGHLFRLPIAALGNGATIRNMDHITARGVFVENPAGFHQPRPPWLMSRCAPAPVGRTAAPGADVDDEPRWSAAESKPKPVHQGLPLEGVRVIDLTAFWAGRAATHLLAAFGADVVKIESIQRPDGIRYSGGMRTDVDDWWEYGWLFHAMNTNKRSVTLDLGSVEGRGLFLRLIADADLVIENFSPRVMDHFGLSADVLLQANPKLVFARMPAFGLDGPWRERVGFAPTMEVRSHHGTDRGPDLVDRIARRATGNAAGSLRPAGRCPCRFCSACRAELCRPNRVGSTGRNADGRSGTEYHRSSAHRVRDVRDYPGPKG